MIPNDVVTRGTAIVTALVAALGLLLHVVSPELQFAMQPEVAWPLIAAGVTAFGISRKVERIAKATENGKK
jgi:hypothetical protein